MRLCLPDSGALRLVPAVLVPAVLVRAVAGPVALLVAAAATGCAPFDPPTCEDVEDFACFTGTLRDLGDSPVADAELCTPDLPGVPCTKTEANGDFTLPGLPQDSDVAVTVVHPDFVPVLFPQNTAFAWYGWNKVAVPNWVMDQHAGRLDVELDDELGSLLFIVWEGLNLDGIDTPRVPGVTAALLTDGDVFYADALGLASSTADATTASGSGGALNLAAGTAQLRLTAEEGPCEEHSFSFAWTGGEPIPVPVRAGFVTAIDVVCPVAR